jgi:hypothetical protein
VTFTVIEWAIYAMLFGIGETIFGQFRLAMLFFAIAASAIAIIWRDLSRRSWRVL